MDRLIADLMALEEFRFKSMRLGESALTSEQMHASLQHLLTTDQGLFLERYGRHLNSDQLKLFEAFKDNYEVSFYLSKLNAQPLSLKKIKNRRFHYLNKFMDPEYFSEDSIREKYPQLYHEYVGQYARTPAQPAPFDESMSLVDRMYHNYDQERLRSMEQKMAQEQLEEFDTESDEDSLDLNGSEERNLKELTEEEREELRAQLLRQVGERFLSGMDDSFDYKQVDENAMYDDVALENVTLSDAYFDAEDSDV